MLHPGSHGTTNLFPMRRILQHLLNRSLPGLCFLMTLSGIGAATESSAQGNLLITPRRVVFDGSSRIKELNLANIGSDSARFIISVMEIRMKPDGSFERIAEPDSGQRFASPYLRIYPRSVSIAPGESQMVKVQLLNTQGLDSGEYRSHIYVRAAPSDKPAAAEASDNSEIAVKLTAIFGISIPAIVRVGASDADVRLSDAAVLNADPQKPRLAVTLQRGGRMSSYGDLSVSCVSAKGRETQVGLVRGIAVYTPNTSRRFEMDLDMSKVGDASDSKLLVRYSTQKDDRNKDTAEISLKLP